MRTSATHLRHAARATPSPLRFARGARVRAAARCALVFRCALILFVTACAAKPTPTPTPTSSPTPIPTPTATPVSQPPDGTYTTSITTDEIAKGGTSAAFVCENAGTYTMTVAANHWSTFQSAAANCTVGNPNDGGTWQLTGSQVVFTEQTSLGCSTVYTYTWSYQDKQLGFTLGKDDCAPRVTELTAHPWVKQE